MKKVIISLFLLLSGLEIFAQTGELSDSPCVAINGESPESSTDDTGGTDPSSDGTRGTGR